MMFLDEFYIRGDRDFMVPAHLNFGKYMLDNIRNYNNEVALVNSATNESITYKQFTQYSVNLATSLMELSVGEGDIVAVGSEKRITLLPTFLGIVFTGATFTPYDLHRGRSVLKHSLSVVKPKYFICSKLFLERYGDILQSFDFINTIIVYEETPNWPDTINMDSLIAKNVDVERFEPTAVKGQIDPAMILYSSGTTGIPKCIVLTHLNSILNVLNDDFRDKDINTVGVIGEWYHNYDIFMSLKFLSAGKKIAYIDQWKIEEVLHCIQTYQVDIAMVVPYVIKILTKYENLNDYKLDSLKIIYSRATILHHKIIEKIIERLPKLQNVLQGYGMTECGEPTSENWGKKGPKPGSVGMASPGTMIKVVDATTGKKLGPNQPGEIRVKGPMFMTKYMQIDSSTYLDEECFFKTGDLGYYDDDKYFFIIDRIKEVIDCLGFKIAPIELETILEQHKDVLEAGVVGQPHPDVGELPVAFVVKKTNSTVTEQELIDFMVEEASRFMQLSGGVRFIEKLPRNSRGKLLRRQLREMLDETLEFDFK